MPKVLIADSSTLFALNRANLIIYLNKINHKIIIPVAIKEEIEKGNDYKIFNYVIVETLKGRSLNKAKTFQKLGIDKGEAECCALAINLKQKFIICDDRKFIRQRYFSNNKDLRQMRIIGFAFLLHLFYKKKLIKNIWQHFGKIISLNNWQRSEVQISNYTLLKELGY